MNRPADNNVRYPIKKNDSLINLNRVIKLITRYWYLFVISIPLTIGSAYVYHRYTVSIYQASATLLFKSSEERSVTGSDLIEGFGLSPEVRNLENQTFILRSFKVVRKAVENNYFGIEYYIDGFLKDTEIYLDAPFRIVLDSSVPQMLNVPFNLKFVSDKSVHIKLQLEGGALYDLQNQTYAKRIGEVNIDRVVNVDEYVETSVGRFKIVKTGGSINQDFTYYFKVRSLDDVANEYKRRLSISTMGEGSSIVFLRVTGTSSRKICRFLDQLCQVVIDYNLDQKNEIATRSINFIQEQLKTISDTLEEAQNKLLSFRKYNRFMDPSSASEQLSNQYFEAESQRKMIDLKRNYFVFLRDKLKENPFETDFMLPAFSDNNHQIVSQLVMELLELNNEYEVYQSDADGVNPYMSSLKQKIGVTRNNLLLAVNKILENLALEEKVIEQQISQIDSEISKLPALEKQYLTIDRSYKLNDAIYTFLLQKNSETQITKASNAPDNEVIDKAHVSGVVSPIKKSNYSKALMLGFLIPSVIIAIIEFLNVKLRSKEDLENLVPNIPIVGIIPHSKIDSANIIQSKPHSVISEAFRSIRTRLNFMAVEKGSKVVSITSTNTGDGKTFISLNLASAFALSGKKVILLGFDLRKPRLTEHFQMSSKKGISNALIGDVSYNEICYNSGQENLCVMPSGDVPPNPSELIESAATKKLFDWLRQNFEVIIVDSPPVGVVADARLLMAHTDIHLYITRYNHTRKDHLQHTVQNLMDENINSLGLIFNDVQNQVDGYGHYYTEYYGEKS